MFLKGYSIFFIIILSAEHFKFQVCLVLKHEFPVKNWGNWSIGAVTYLSLNTVQTSWFLILSITFMGLTFNSCDYSFQCLCTVKKIIFPIVISNVNLVRAAVSVFPLPAERSLWSVFCGFWLANYWQTLGGLSLMIFKFSTVTDGSPIKK